MARDDDRKRIEELEEELDAIRERINQILDDEDDEDEA
jgi:predicted transcriptional regulator